MNFIKKNAVLVGMIVAFVILLGGSIYLLIQKRDQCHNVGDELEQKISERKRLWEGTPFPSDENTKIFDENTKMIRERSLEIIKNLSKTPLSFDAMDGLKCKGEILAARRAMSDNLQSHNILFPPEFHFGFDRYKDKTPRKEDTPLIQKQLKISEEIIDLCAKAQIGEVLSMRRVEFEEPDVVPATGRSMPMTTVKPAVHSSTTEPLFSMGSDFFYADQPDYAYSTLPFELEIKCDTDAFRTLMNSLSTAPYLLVPRIINIENERKEAMAGTAIPAAVPGKSAGSPRGGMNPLHEFDPMVGQAGLPGAVKMDPYSLPFVLGNEKIRVGIRIEYIEFRPEKQVADAKKH